MRKQYSDAFIEQALIKVYSRGDRMLWSNLPGHLNRWKIHHLRKKHDIKKT